MVFVEFVFADFPHPGEKCHFVGASLDDVLADTKGGKEFGMGHFSSHREITEKEARALGLGFLEEGISSVVRERCKSFMLRTPRTPVNMAG